MKRLNYKKLELETMKNANCRTIKQDCFPGIRLWVFALLAVGLLAFGQPAQALIYTYDNTTSGAIPFHNANSCATNLTRTFTVPDSFTVSSVAIGLNLSHTERGDVRAILVAPGGLTFNPIVQSNDTNDNYDILVSTNTDGAGQPPLNDNDIDPITEPYYNRLVSNAGMDFYTGNAQGTWILRLCDRDNNGVNGTFNRAKLILQSTTGTTTSGTSTLTYDWGSNGDNVDFISATVGGVTITETSTVNFGASSSLNNFQTRTSTIGNHTGYYRLSMDAPDGTDSEVIGNRVVFSFSSPVRDLSFSLLDVDWENVASDFEDQASIFATDSAGNPVPFTATPAGGAVQMAGNTGEGDAGAAADQTIANIEIRFQGAVSNLTVEYTQGDEPTASADQQAMGISDFTFVAFDYGDAPNSYGTQLSSGARHVLGSRNLYLGANPPDGESDGAPGAAAATDDTTQVGGVDDEDGVTPPFPASSTSAGVYTVNVAYTNNTDADARLCGWIDFNKNGAFTSIDPNNERACNTVGKGTSFASLVFTVPTDSRNNTCTDDSPCYARFRIASTTSEAEAATGLANNGEVEDYQITNIESLPITLASVDARQSPSGLTVEWTTATETRNAGFHLYGRMTGEADWQPLTATLIPSNVIDSLEPQHYSARFPGVVADELLIEDWDTQGQTQRHGPFAVGRKHGFDAVTAAQPIKWAAIHAENEQTQRQTQSLMRTFSAAGTPDALLWVTQPGVQRITFNELQAAGANFSGVAIADLALTDAGKKQPRYVIDANNNGQFDSGDTLEFLGEVTQTLYSARNAYRLSVGRNGVSEANSLSLDPKNAASGVFSHEVKVEQQRAYSFAAPGNDPWYDQWLFAYTSPVSLERTFDLPGYAGGEARLTLRHWGVTDWPGDAPDHHLIVKVNGQQVDEARFDGSVDASRTLALAGVRATGNTLTLEAPGDTGYAYDIQALDNFSVQYPRHTQADNGAWQGELPSGAKILITGFQGESVAWRNAQRRVGGEQLIVNGQGLWVAADSRAIRRPTIQVDLPAPAAEPKAKEVDYLIISHPLFIDSPAMNDLVALQQGRGYRTAVVDVETLYAASSDFEVSADAIGRYLKQAKPRFVLLVGGDSNDYHNYLGLASQSFIPTRYAQTDALVTYAPADGWYVDYNNDGKPQAALGRLPVRTVAELSQVVAKIIHAPLLKYAVLGAGPSDDGRQFATTSKGYAAQLPSTWTHQLIAVDERGLAPAKTALQTELNLGGALVSYIGHSSYALWGLNASGILLSATEARQLSNSTPLLVTQWGCWNTYFANPRQDTMANAFLFQSYGASAVLGATALTDIGLLSGLGNAFFKQLGQSTTLGEALQAAQRTYLNQSPAAASGLRGFALLGDPAAPIR